MHIQGWLVFLIIGFIHSLFYTIWRDDIFEWHADPDEENVERRKALKDKRDLIQSKVGRDKPPKAWLIERRLHVFLGMVAGWIFLWILVDKRINLFCNPDFKNLGVADLVLFLLGWIGINGRLPSIAHSIEGIMKSGISISSGK